MNLTTVYQVRRLIPRWRKYGDILFLPEMGSSKKPKSFVPKEDPYFTDNLIQWESAHTIDNAVELVSYALVIGAPQYADKAAEYILNNRENITQAQKRLAEEVLMHLNGVNNSDTINNIAINQN